LLAQKRKFFLSPSKRNNAPTVSNTPPTGSKPKGTSDSMRNATTPMPKKIALRDMWTHALAATLLLKRKAVLRL